MNSFNENNLKRESIISSLSSKDSIESELSIILNRSKVSLNSFGFKIEDNRRKALLNKNSEEKITFSEQFLFFGPLILCLILLISGIILFIIVEQQNNKNENKEIKLNHSLDLMLNESFMPILCPFVKPDNNVEFNFAHNELKCGLHRSSIINLYFSKNSNPMSQGEYLITDILTSPVVKLDYEFLSKFNTRSFVLILLDPAMMPLFTTQIFLHWVRYFSSSLEDEEDICYYKVEYFGHTLSTEHKIVLLYATDSSLMIIKAKTICYQTMDFFLLSEYVPFIKLKLIASTNFFVPYKNTTHS